MARAGGMAISFSRRRVTTPRVPSAPTINLVSSSPAEDCLAREPTEPVSITWPSGRTTSRPNTQALVGPYLTARMPWALVEAIPPTVAMRLEPGSGGNSKPCGASAAFNWAWTTPGSQNACMLATSISRTRFMALSARTIPPVRATAPAAWPLAAPRGVTAIWRALAKRITALTSSVLSAITTASGALGASCVRNEASYA